VAFPAELASLLSEYRHTLLATRHPGLLEGRVFPNGAGTPRANGSLCDANRRALAHAGITKRVTIHGLRRTATDLLCRAAVDSVAATAIASARLPTACATARDAERRGDLRQRRARVASLVPAVHVARGG
jgi:integrase